MSSHDPEYKIAKYGTIDVYYRDHLDGGGQQFGQDYLRIIRMLPVRPRTVFEWCSGPGFIGFSLLANGLCDRLCLADVSPEAVAACRKTVEANGLGRRVTIYQSDCFDAIPAQERWDLVVGNPPHSGTGNEIKAWGGNKLIYMDPGWNLRRRFWAGIQSFLNPHGVVLLQENSDLSKVSDFAEMIETNGMRITYVSELGAPFTTIAIYYLGAARAEDAATLRGIGVSQHW